MQSLKSVAVNKGFYPNIKPVIGLEVHAQLKLKSKLFSQGSNKVTAPPNTQLDLFDISLPGTLPKLNQLALRSGILTSLGLNCAIQNEIHFDRKNYFYTDMPAGYQITQYNKPLSKDGYVEFVVTSYHRLKASLAERYDIVKYLGMNGNDQSITPYIKRSRIKQIQLEQDSAKSLHEAMNGEEAAKYSLVDYNRAGAALVEIVFDPDLENHHEASSLVKELINTLKTLETCDCELQEGSLRVDANVSIREFDGQTLENSSRVELKNLNSIRSLNYGIAYEINRQANLIKSGKVIVQESRACDYRSGKSVSLREKESAVDYRYVPEPSIPPLTISYDFIKNVSDQLGKVRLPRDQRNELIEAYPNLELTMVVDLLETPGLCGYFFDVMDGLELNSVNIVADFLIFATASLKDISGVQVKVSFEAGETFLDRLPAEKMRIIIEMLIRDQISYMNAFEVVKYVFINNVSEDPQTIVDELRLKLIADDATIKEYCDSLISGMKNISKKYKNTGDKRYMLMMLKKLSELHQDNVSVRKAIEILNNKLRPTP